MGGGHDWRSYLAVWQRLASLTKEKVDGPTEGHYSTHTSSLTRQPFTRSFQTGSPVGLVCIYLHRVAIFPYENVPKKTSVSTTIESWVYSGRILTLAILSSANSD